MPVDQIAPDPAIVIEAMFGGDERKFALPIDQVLALQEIRDCAPVTLCDRLRTGEWRVEDVREVLRLGLIGGGVDAKPAKRLVDAHVVSGKLLQCASLAFDIVWRALVSPEAVGKTPATTGAPEVMAASPPSPFMEPVP